MCSAIAPVILRVFRIDPDWIRIVRITGNIKNVISTSELIESKASKCLVTNTHSSVSASCASAFFAIVWKACSTLIASFAEVSK